MKETLCEAENHTNRFNIEAFPAHSLPSFLVSVVVAPVTAFQVLQVSQCILKKDTFYQISDFFFFLRLYSDH